MENKHLTDSEELLKETDAGCKTAVNSIEAVMERTDNPQLHSLLTESLKTHQRLGDEIGNMLKEQGKSGKEPGVMARTMAEMKIDMKMLIEPTDHTIATLMMDGCNMGIQKLGEYVNQYHTADREVKQMAEKLISAEQKFMDDLRTFL